MADIQPSPVTHEDDPYLIYKIRLKWDGKYCAGFSSIRAVSKRKNDIDHDVDSDRPAPPNIPRIGGFIALALSIGVSYDQEFSVWATQVWNFGDEMGMKSSLASFRRDITIEMYDGAGDALEAYNVYRCWPTEFSAMSSNDADARGLQIQSLTLANEGWERDVSIAVPPDPSFVLPTN